MSQPRETIIESPLTAKSERVSIIICTVNRNTKLIRCLQSICESTHQNIEVIVVDQTPDQDHFASELLDHRIRYIRVKFLGLSKARNLGIELATSEILAFTDDDCIVSPDWVEKIVECLRLYPEVIAVFGRVLAWSPFNDGLTYVHDTTDKGRTTYCKSSSGLLCFALSDFAEERVIDTRCLPYANLGSGNNMAFRRSELLKLGKFMEGLGAGAAYKSAEDTELQYRALRRGLGMLYSPRPVVFHDRWLEPSEVKALMEGYLIGVAAVFTFYSLVLDSMAIQLLWFELKNAIKDCLKIRQQNVSYARILLWGVILSWLKGVRGGISLRLRVYDF